MRASEPSALADLFARNLDEVGGAVARHLPRMLRAIRQHLHMDVGFVAEFTDGQRVFRRVDLRPGLAPDHEVPVVGHGHPLEETYCKRIVDGRLPEVIPDCRAEPRVRDMNATRALNIGAYMGVPLRLGDGSVYGTLCCYNFQATPDLNERDLDLLRVLGEAMSDVIEHDLVSRQREDAFSHSLGLALHAGGMRTVYQPIIDLGSGETEGFEALARFAVPLELDTEEWFATATDIGQGMALEMQALRCALADFERLPERRYLSVNLSAASLVSEQLEAQLATVPLQRVVLEITERTPIHQYDDVRRALAKYRERGARLAVDDAGAGYASFRHILVLQPDLIKLDKSLVRNVDSDPSRRELARALIQFARKTGSQLIAEGVETERELASLRAMGVRLAQGFYLGRPGPLELAA